MGIGSLISKAGVSVAVKKLGSMLPSALTTDLFNKMAQDAALECEGFLMKMVERMGGDPEAAIARLANSVTEEEAAAMTGRLMREAVFSATKDRRRLMAAAMAGSFSPEFEVEQKSRITRAIAQLEPSDVLILRGIASGGPYGGSTLKTLARSQEVGMAALEAAGCIVEVRPSQLSARSSAYRSPEGARHRATELGSMTLRFIADWVPEESTD